jgi:hypothetical protein
MHLTEFPRSLIIITDGTMMASSTETITTPANSSEA